MLYSQHPKEAGLLVSNQAKLEEKLDKGLIDMLMTVTKPYDRNFN